MIFEEFCLSKLNENIVKIKITNCFITHIDYFQKDFSSFLSLKTCKFSFNNSENFTARQDKLIINSINSYLSLKKLILWRIFDESLLLSIHTLSNLEKLHIIGYAISDVFLVLISKYLKQLSVLRII